MSKPFQRIQRMKWMFGRERWQLSHGQVTGAMHFKTQSPCQDAIKYKKLEDGSLICAVADGHGSKACPYSKEGAELATQVAVSLIEEVIFYNAQEQIYPLLRQTGEVLLPQEIERKWKEAVTHQHQIKGRTPLESRALYRLYGTTLMLLYVTASFVFSLQIGDGDLLCIDEHGQVEYVIEPTKTYGVETQSLCNTACWRYFKTICKPLVSKEILLMMSTDGYANSFIHQEAFFEAGRDYMNLIQSGKIQGLEAALPQWLSEATKVGSGDDITLALIYRQEG